MELACGHVYFVNTVNYVYNYNTGQNDWILYSNEQGVADVSIRAKKKMECLPEFKERPIITWLCIIHHNFKQISLYLW